MPQDCGPSRSPGASFLRRTLTIFDCDGVLVDSELIALGELSARMSELGASMTIPECLDAFMGMHNADIVGAMERRLGRSLPGEGPHLRGRMIERFKRDLQPIPGIADALARLAGPLCVASSSDRARIEFTLDLTGLGGHFRGRIFSGTEVAYGKPAPDLFLYAAAAMGAAPSDCVVVEDSVNGVRAGVAAGMPVIGFVGGAHATGDLGDRLRVAGAVGVIALAADLPAAIDAVPGWTPRRP